MQLRGCLHLDRLREDAAELHISILLHGQRGTDGGQALLLHKLHQRSLRRQPAHAQRMP